MAMILKSQDVVFMIIQAVVQYKRNTVINHYYHALSHGFPFILCKNRPTFTYLQIMWTT